MSCVSLDLITLIKEKEETHRPKRLSVVKTRWRDKSRKLKEVFLLWWWRVQRDFSDQGKEEAVNGDKVRAKEVKGEETIKGQWEDDEEVKEGRRSSPEDIPWDMIYRTKKTVHVKEETMQWENFMSRKWKTWTLFESSSFGSSVITRWSSQWWSSFWLQGFKHIWYPSFCCRSDWLSTTETIFNEICSPLSCLLVFVHLSCVFQLLFRKRKQRQMFFSLRSSSQAKKTIFDTKSSLCDSGSVLWLANCRPLTVSHCLSFWFMCGDNTRFLCLRFFTTKKWEGGHDDHHAALMTLQDKEIHCKRQNICFSLCVVLHLLIPCMFCRLRMTSCSNTASRKKKSIPKILSRWW